MEKPAVDKKAIKQFFDFCKENEVEFIDFRVTDIKGIWHHFSFSASSIDESSFEGIPFDGSSFPAWQPVHQSDMILIPDPVRYFIDPFTADTTIVVFCDVWDIYKNKPYEKCPRSIIKRAMKHLNESGIGDVAYFGPENEFFIFDSIKMKDSVNCQYYEIDTEEGEWNRSKEYEGVNLGHRPGTKGGYFPVAPVDSMVDLRA
ncbi:glutamine synthetase beta-grasp domain-containing protein, partial [Helicobacter ganmani]